MPQLEQSRRRNADRTPHDEPRVASIVIPRNVASPDVNSLTTIVASGPRASSYAATRSSSNQTSVEPFVKTPQRDAIFVTNSKPQPDSVAFG